MEMNPANIAVLIPIVAILGGIAIVVVSIVSKARLRELEIKERIAMIERGLVPAPEADPRGFDRALSSLDRAQRIQQWQGGAASRHRRAGITLMGVGFGLMVLISFAGESPSSAFGVGGFLVVIGLAFFINALFDHRSASRALSTSSAPPTSAEPPRQN